MVCNRKTWHRVVKFGSFRPLPAMKGCYREDRQRAQRQSAFSKETTRRGWRRATPGASPNVVLMDGGCLYVPNAQYGEFLELYALYASDPTPLFVVERPSCHMRFFADFDCHLSFPPSEPALLCDAHHESIEQFCSSLERRFTSYACEEADLSSPVVVMHAKPKVLRVDTIDGSSPQLIVKVGVHFVLPQSCVSDEDAIRHREAILRKLIRDQEGDGATTAFEDEDNTSAHTTGQAPCNGWHDAFDVSVYTQGGLRMVGSHKMERCPCAADDHRCPHPRRRVDAGRPYEFVHVLCPDGSTNALWTQKLRADPIARVRMCSIRVLGAARDAEDDTSRGTKTALRKRRRLGDASAPLAACAAAHTTQNRSKQLTVRDLLTNEAVRRLGPRHAALYVHDVTELRRAGNVSAPMALILTATHDLAGDAICRWCPNVQREHSRSSVYFVVDALRSSISLRCRCAKGTCREFRGAALSMTSAGTRALGIGGSHGLPPGFSG